ncbi:MAG: LamG-like jellyroll fold domain-containing protein [Kiritimatiellia bacterium]|jgi:hypothetical protein|nr:LamG-like jellyroll fold domain-containing protein [Kiritimatiellia bacterium]
MRNLFRVMFAAIFFSSFDGRANIVLVGHWRMNEAGGTTDLVPSVGNRAIALKNGAAAGSSGVEATGVLMPAGAGHILDSTQLVPSTDDFGVFLWIAFTNTPGSTTQMHLFSCNAGQVNRANFMIIDSGDRLGWFHNGGLGCTGSTAINDGAWHHVGLTRRGGRMQLWVDGLPDCAETAVTTASISQAQDWRIGSFVSENSGLFRGRMDDLRIYHGTLSVHEIEALVSECIPQQMEHRWTFDAETGGSLLAPENGWMAAIAKKIPTTGVLAPQKTGIAFDGQNLLRIPASRFLIPATNDFSVFLWMRDDAAVASTVQYLSCNGGPTQLNRCSFGNSFNTSTSAGKLFFFHPDATLTGATSVRDSGWHHVGLVRRGNMVELWLDGERDAIREYGEGFSLSQSYDWRVGASAAENVNFFKGRMDDLRFYTNALAVADIVRLFDSYTPTNSLVAHWPLNDAANKRFLIPSAGWREIESINQLQSGAEGVETNGVWANSASRGRILGSKKLIPATNDFTVLLWMRTKNTTTPEKHLFTNNRGQAGRCNLTLDATAGKVTWWVNNTFGLVSVSAGSGPVVDDGMWHQVGLSRAGKTFRLWVDGVNVSTATSAYVGIPAISQSNDWFIASNASDAGAAFYGAVGTGYALMDDLRVYNYALTVSEVNALYSGFQPIPDGIPSAPETDHSMIEAATGGKVVGHLAAISGESDFHLPSLLVCGDGSYKASATVLTSPLGTHAKIYRSSDAGLSWSTLSIVAPQYGGTLFESDVALYLIGNTYDGGMLVIRRSEDGGVTWTLPESAASGILTETTGWHFRGGEPVIHNGRVWVYVERRGNTLRGSYPANVEAGAMSAPVGTDLLNAENWTLTQPLTLIPETWDPSVTFGGWSNGRALVDRNGALCMALSTVSVGGSEYLSLLAAGTSPDEGFTVSPMTDGVLLPGGGTSFAVRYDPVTRRYWAVTNPDNIAQLGLFSSFTLHDWAFHGMLLEAQAGSLQTFSVPDSKIIDNDLITLCRAAYPDQDGEPLARNHLMFKRIPGFYHLPSDKQPGRLLLADTGNDCVRRYSYGAAGNWLFDDGAKPIFAGGVYAGLTLRSPYGLTMANGRIYVGERVAGGRVLVFTLRGAFQGVTYTFGPEVIPGSLAASGSTIFMSDEAGNQVWRIDPETGSSSVWLARVGTGYAFQELRGIAIDDAGNLYVADRSADLIMEFNAAGERVKEISQDAPETLLWDAEGSRLIASVYLTPDIVSVNLDGGTVTKLLDNGIGNQRFIGLASVLDRLYFTSDSMNRVNRQDGPSSYRAADIRVAVPGHLLHIPQGGDVYPDAALGTFMWLR